MKTLSEFFPEIPSEQLKSREVRTRQFSAKHSFTDEERAKSRDDDYRHGSSPSRGSPRVFHEVEFHLFLTPTAGSERMPFAPKGVPIMQFSARSLRQVAPFSGT